MDPDSPGSGMPHSSPLPHGPSHDDSRVIRVVSRDDSPPPESLPFAQSWGSSSRPRTMPLSQQSRSRSMTDVRGGLKKTSGNLYLHWKKNDSKTLPSCQINPRRSPLGGKTCRSPTTSQDLVRRDSNSSGSSLGRQSVELERSLSADATSPAASQQRNKGDSGIVSDEFLPSPSVHSGKLLDVGSTSSHPKYQSTLDAQYQTAFVSNDDSDSQCDINTNSRFLDAAEKPRRRRHRNHSESEILNPPTSNFDDEYFSDSASKKHKHRSLESLNRLKDNATLFPDFLPGSFGAPVVDVEFEGWGQALKSESRTDSLEHLNCGRSWRGSDSADNEDDDLNVSWSSTGWRKSVLSRCSMSSEGSADDVFSGNEDRVGEISDAFQSYSVSKMLGCVHNSELVTQQNHRATQVTQRKEGKSTLPVQSVQSSIKTKNNLPNSQHIIRDNEYAKKREMLLSKSPTHIDVQTEKSYAFDQKSTRKSVSGEQFDFYYPSESSSALLPNLQKTLEAVRRHIKSKKSSGSASKIPVRQQISPNRRTSRPADTSREQSRRSSSASSTNSVITEQAVPTSLAPSGTVLQESSDTISSSAEDKGTTRNSNLNSKVLISTAVTLANAPALGDFNESRQNVGGSVAGSVSPSCISDEMLSVFSPRPPRLENCQPSTENLDTNSSHAIVESSRLGASESTDRTFYSSKEDGPSRTTRVSSPRKKESSSRKLDSSRRDKAKVGETSTLRKNKRKASSRVDYILNNDLFRKHLSGHIDLVEKNILHIKKFGLKKSFSNLDLTVTDSERLQAAFESSLKLHDIDLDGSFSDDSKPTDIESAPKLADLNSSQSSLTPTKSNSTVDEAKTPRRKSIACDDPSLKQLHDAFRQGRTFSQTQLTVTKRSRVHIPSYDEFRKQRQKERATRPADHNPSAAGSSSAKCDDNLDGLMTNYRTLDTITEDDCTDTARSASGGTVTLTVPMISVEHVEDDLHETRYREHISQEPPFDLNYGDNRKESEQRLTSVPRGNEHNETRQVVAKSRNLPQGHSETVVQNEIQLAHPKLVRASSANNLSIDSNTGNLERENLQPISHDKLQLTHPKPVRSSSASNLTIYSKTGNLEREHSQPIPQNTSQLTHPKFQRASSARNLSIDSNTGKLEKENSQALPPNKAQLTHPKPKRASSAKNLSINLSETQTITTTSSTISPQNQNYRTLPTPGFTDRHSHGERSAQEESGSDANTECLDGFEVESNIDHTLHGSSGSSDATLHEEFSDGETDPDDVHGDWGRRPGAGSMVDGDNLYLLFDDRAVAMDTDAWSRLFTQTHKFRRKEDSRSSKHLRHHSSKEEKPHAVPVLRSSSDVTGQMTSIDQTGHRKRRLRKERPYKSDPFADGAGSISYNDSSSCINSGSSSGRPGDEGAMRFLEQGSISRDSQASSFPSLEELTEVSSNSEEDSECEIQDEGRSKKRLSNISTASEDSGVVGQEGSSVETFSPGPPSSQPRITAPGLHTPQVTSCFHCKPSDLELRAETSEEDALLCDKCLHHQQERRDTIYEIIETEINYGRDLRILKEEFLVPMQTTGLLTAEQLHTVFTNLDDLISINTQLTEKLRAALHNAVKDCDQNLNLVNIGSLFVESSTMFLAFESYCINQAQAQAALEQLERERELLRIFLQVSQTENGLLRRMHLKSFLMVPVQRIMKYPLLLNRLYKATPAHHVDKEDIRQAREKIEDILGHINAKTKGSGSVFIKRKQSEMRRYSLAEKIEVNRVALEVLGWSKKEVCDLITSRMWYAQPPDHTWAAKRCRNVKFTRVHAVLFTLGQKRNDNMNLGQQAAVVLVREKNGKYQAIRDPFLLDKSVVTVDPDCDDVFELQEWGREAYIFKADGLRETHTWIQHLRQQTHNLGQWRRRRNALPNIMLKNV